MKNYKAYLNSPHWIKFRSTYYKESPVIKSMKKNLGMVVCRFCRQDKPLQIHHITYKRIGKERWGDVVSICGDCHQKIHFGENSKLGIRRSTNKLWRKAMRNKKLWTPQP